MRQKELLDSVKKHLARFEAQVRISNLNNEYDINIHAESVLIPILNILYHCNLKNANYSEEKNNEAIDLIDNDNRIAFQITSTNNLKKIKDTLFKFVNSKFVDQIDHLFVYTLKEKQMYYTQEVLTKITENKINFSVKENILDASDVYRKLYVCNDLSTIEIVENILKKQFSDIYINKSLTLAIYENFKKNYAQSCISNFSRINFFGLSINTNRPREIELAPLFVDPIFLTGGKSKEFFLPQDEYDLIKDFNSNKFNLNPPEISYLYKTEIIDRHLLGMGIKFLPHPFENDYHTHYSINSKESSALKQTNEKCLFTDLFSGPRNIVVIGNPGAGKSMFIKYSICILLKREMNFFSNKEIYEYLPFRIELHKYNKFKKSKSEGILDYLVILLKTEYQQIVSRESLLSILQILPVVFFFDGLDEIFNIQERIAVRNEIEIFSESYPRMRSVVTSRYESYEEVKMSDKIFSKVILLDFDNLQIEDYVRKWYAIEESNLDVRTREISSCLTQLKNVDSELKNNPLLLSLILLLYRNEANIPTNKLSIYESCTNTIVETRDTKEKSLDFTLKTKNKISVFASLAYWQFKNESQDNLLPSFKVVKDHIKNYLLEKKEFEEENMASLAADEFLEFAKLRSIYFENKFTHKTFLEYFTSYYIYSYYYANWHNTKVLSKLLSTYIGLSSWSIVLELLVYKIDSIQINYEVIDELMLTIYRRKALDTLVFLLPLLKYLQNISLKTIKFFIRKSMLICIKDSRLIKESELHYRELLFNQLCLLGNVERFKEIIPDIFIEIIELKKFNNLLINNFAYEFETSSNNKGLVNILIKKDIESKREYIFILKNQQFTTNNIQYLESLKNFINIFSLSATVKSHSSPFKKKLFIDSEKFNWIISYLSKNIEEQSLYSSFEQLLAVGIPTSILKKAIKNNSNMIPGLLIKSNLNFYSNSNKNDNLFEPIIKTLLAYNIPNEKSKLLREKFVKKRFFKYLDYSWEVIVNVGRKYMGKNEKNIWR